MIEDGSEKLHDAVTKCKKHGVVRLTNLAIWPTTTT